MNVILIATAIGFFCAVPGWGTDSPRATRDRPLSEVHPSLEEQWGVSVVGTRLSAHGYMVDFRYRIIDAEKAAPLLDRKIAPYLVDEASGRKFSVPQGPKVGSLRAKGTPVAGRTCYILFSNARGEIKKGSRVTVVIGDFKAEDLLVE